MPQLQPREIDEEFTLDSIQWVNKALWNILVRAGKKQGILGVIQSHALRAYLLSKPDSDENHSRIIKMSLTWSIR